ncbi:MAG: (R)-citramalate synthase [uncultured Frankineae bacterium]|uniref:Citramalate synthase n=1 Tax=uncultured Frankineae bacterium TaxID=437475 RepID=A0A6J4L174_9ACTN|nr:MAG: (R)-citramalate synthase [uncultured Frankineae bacterium]
MNRPPDVLRPADTFHVYDTTLRDGSQREGMALSVNDKLAIARHLDDLGVGFIEGGWPGANPKDAEFFRRARTELDLSVAQLAAFGSTRRPGGDAATDLAHLRESGAGTVTLVAKADVRHVERALRTTREENLAMVRDSVAHLRGEGQRVFLDAEHFFDGYAADPAYAVEVLRAAAEAGADVLVLCDTNGGMLPYRLSQVVAEVVATGLRVGIHAHDDTACAVANSLAAVDAGATHVQGTANGYGERCGNADLFSVVAALEAKAGRSVLPPGRLVELGRVAHAVAEVANIAPDPHQPWVGASAFAHKAGLHVSAVKADPDLYQHADPAVVGNDMRLLVSELAGRATIELKGRALGLEPDAATVLRVLDSVKDLESVGYAFEAAEASFELLLREQMGQRPRYFDLESWRVIVEARAGQVVSEATVKLHAGGERIVATGEGNGPVHALDTALRSALCGLYPGLGELELVDYKVRIISGEHGTDAVTRVLVQTSDGEREWGTVGVHENVIAASWQALEEAYTTGLLRQGAGTSATPAAVGGRR